MYNKYLLNFSNLFLKKKLKRTQKITKYFLGKIVYIHNGQTFKKIKVTPFRLNTKCGEYSFTRTFVSHQKKKKK